MTQPIGIAGRRPRRLLGALEPWGMSGEQQAAAVCAIGRDYPAPIVDHAEERRRALARYRAAAAT